MLAYQSFLLYEMYLDDYAAMQQKIADPTIFGRAYFPAAYWNYSIISLAFAAAIGAAGAILWSARNRQNRAERPATAFSFALIAAALLYFGIISDFLVYVPIPVLF